MSLGWDVLYNTRRIHQTSRRPITAYSGGCNTHFESVDEIRINGSTALSYPKTYNFSGTKFIARPQYGLKLSKATANILIEQFNLLSFIINAECS